MSAVAAESPLTSSSGTGEKARPKPPRFAVGITALTFFVLYFPLLIVMALSIQDTDGSWTLKWYAASFENEALRSSLMMSFWIATVSTIFSTILGTLAAYALERSKFWGHQIFDALNLIPLIMPEIVMGLSLLIWFVFLKITLGPLSMMLAHTTFCLSFVIITVRARLQDFDISIEEAARDLGASPVQVFFRVTLPLIWPGILSGGLLAFTLSFDDFLIAYFTAGVGSDTLPVKLYSMIKFGVSPVINALSTIIILATVLLVLLAVIPQNRRKKRELK